MWANVAFWHSYTGFDLKTKYIASMAVIIPLKKHVALHYSGKNNEQQSHIYFILIYLAVLPQQMMNKED